MAHKTLYGTLTPQKGCDQHSQITFRLHISEGASPGTCFTYRVYETGLNGAVICFTERPTEGVIYERKLLLSTNKILGEGHMTQLEEGPRFMIMYTGNEELHQLVRFLLANTQKHTETY